MAPVSAAVRTTADFSLYQTARRFYRPYRAALPVLLLPSPCPYRRTERRAEQQLPFGLKERVTSGLHGKKNPGQHDIKGHISKAESFVRPEGLTVAL